MAPPQNCRRKAQRTREQNAAAARGACAVKPLLRGSPTGSDFSLLEEVQMNVRRISPQGSRGPLGSNRGAAADDLRDVARREEEG